MMRMLAFGFMANAHKSSNNSPSHVNLSESDIPDCNSLKVKVAIELMGVVAEVVVLLVPT